MTSTVALFQTHLFSTPILAAYQKLVEEVSLATDVVALFDEGARNRPPPGKNIELYPFNSRELGRRLSQERLFPGYMPAAIIDFYQAHGTYDYFWFIEYDVRFTGRWSLLLDHFRGSKSDLLSTVIRCYQSDSRWSWWRSLEVPDSQVPMESRLACFHPITRYSAAALEEIARCYEAGWRGHSEVLVPTALDRAGLRLRDIGGRGPWVRAEDRDRFYILSRPSPFGRWLGRWLDRGTFRWRPPFSRPGSRPNKLYHPVKEPGWRAGHLLPDQ